MDKGVVDWEAMIILPSSTWVATEVDPGSLLFHVPDGNWLTCRIRQGHIDSRLTTERPH
jgi:hypothetical protein